MIVLSLFDGMSCGLVALKRAGIPVKKYYASEIDKYAIQISKKNHPEIIHLGDIQQWKKWNIEKPDLIIGGSPCQGFSFAGKRLNLEDERSKLFFEFRDIVRHYEPDYFLLENVRMDKESENVISREMGIQPVLINSALVSAQNRERLYWTNIDAKKDLFGEMLPGIEQPEDKKIYLKDIIINAEADRQKSVALIARYSHASPSNAQIKRYKEKSMQASMYKGEAANGVTIIPTNGCLQIGEADINAHDERKRVYSVDGKCPTLLTPSGGYSERKISTDNTTWRKLTPIECERLQTLPDNYTEGVSNTQRYKMLGNGWTVDIIVNILKQIKNYESI